LRGKQYKKTKKKMAESKKKYRCRSTGLVDEKQPKMAGDFFSSRKTALFGSEKNRVMRINDK